MAHRNRITVNKLNPNLGGVCGGGDSFTPSPCWYFLNNSETVKAITLAFCSIRLATFVLNLVFLTRPSL